MSLKSFHVIFIFLAALVCLGLGSMIWLSDDQALASLKVSGLVSFIIGLGLIAYGIWFIKKKSKAIII